jgi:hypothetical protein
MLGTVSPRSGVCRNDPVIGAGACVSRDAAADHARLLGPLNKRKPMRMPTDCPGRAAKATSLAHTGSVMPRAADRCWVRDTTATPLLTQ